MDAVLCGGVWGGSVIIIVCLVRAIEFSKGRASARQHRKLRGQTLVAPMLCDVNLATDLTPFQNSQRFCPELPFGIFPICPKFVGKKTKSAFWEPFPLEPASCRGVKKKQPKNLPSTIIPFAINNHNLQRNNESSFKACCETFVSWREWREESSSRCDHGYPPPMGGWQLRPILSIIIIIVFGSAALFLDEP